MTRTYIAVGIAAVALPAIFSSLYLYRLHDRIASRTTRSRGRHDPTRSDDPPAPKSLPAHVTSDPDSWIVHYERVVSSPISLSSLLKAKTAPSQSQTSDLMRSYLRACHSAFSRTIQASLISLFIKNADANRTFSAEHIQSLTFRLGDRVNGVYTVVYVGEGNVPGSERVELALDPPKGYSGPSSQGRIVSEIVRLDGTDGNAAEDRVQLVNDTWMWRKENEPRTLLEGGLGAHIHALTSGWLVLEGLKSIEERRKSQR